MRFTRFGKRLVSVMAGIALLFLPGCGGSSDSSPGKPPPDFVVCSSTFANCTTALCTQIPDDPQYATCTCTVQTSYSAGLTACQGIQQTPQGMTVVSRYYPINSYARCNNDRPWSMCLDSPCIIDPNNPYQASCRCTILQSQGPYIVVEADRNYSNTTCENGVNSYATVVDVNQVTDYLRTHNTPLKTFPIKAFKAQQK